jgi:hypothetical protein
MSWVMIISDSWISGTDDARERAEFHVDQGEPDVRIMEIEADVSPYDFVISDDVTLTTWEDEDTDTIFISTSNIRKHLGISVRKSQSSEWFAVGRIPAELIVAKYDYCMRYIW